jgi:1,4-dihydroxy-2-naphthoate polyprenyltransferase
MTRPAFVLITVVACVLGTATASACGCGFDLLLAASATVLAAATHAMGNVINDLHDARTGTDALNQAGIYPFTGGSRLIQTGRVTEQQTAELAKALAILIVPAGLLLAIKTGPMVLVLGLAGMLLAWAYSAPPLKLAARGLGETTVALVWFLVVIGADVVQRRQLFVIPASAALGYALMVASLLLINGFPDAQADAATGKRTLAVRLGPDAATGLYAALALGAHAWLLVSVWLYIPPTTALWGLISLPFSLHAIVALVRHRHQPQALRPALISTVAATLLHGLGMAVGFAWLALHR